MDKLTYYYLYGMNRLNAKMHREEGIETIEWIALAAVILALLAGMMMFIRWQGMSLGSLIVSRMRRWVMRW